MSRSQRLALVLGLNVALVAALVIVGVTAHSLGVLAAGVDYLADAAAIAVSLFAIRLAHRPERSAARANATNIAALVNAGWLLALNVWIAVAASRRLVSGVPEVHGLPVLIVSAIAAVVMLAGALIVGTDVEDADGKEDLNIKAVLLDTAADAGAAAGVAVTGAIIFRHRPLELARPRRRASHCRRNRVPGRRIDLACPRRARNPHLRRHINT